MIGVIGDRHGQRRRGRYRGRGPIGEPAILSTFADARQTFGDYDPWADGAQDELTLVRALQQVFGNGSLDRLRRPLRGDGLRRRLRARC